MTPDERYARCEALVVSFEGGYVANPKDPGGPTNMGVTIPALSEYFGRPANAADVRALTPEGVKPIYRLLYWAAVAGEALPAGVDLMAFDTAVNMGRGRAAGFLQLAAGLTGAAVDRAIGPATLAAVAAADPLALVARMRTLRAGLYRSLPTFPTFGRGWLNRLEAVAATATAWAAR